MIITTGFPQVKISFGDALRAVNKSIYWRASGRIRRRRGGVRCVTALGVYCVGHNSSGNHRCFEEGGSRPVWVETEGRRREERWILGGWEPDTEKRKKTSLSASSSPEQRPSHSRAAPESEHGAADTSAQKLSIRDQRTQIWGTSGV